GSESTESFSCFKKAIELKPDYDEARYNLGTSQLACGQLSEAIDNYRKAIELDPNNLDFRCSLATTLRHQSRYEEAAQILREGLQIDPSHADTHFGLGYIYQSEGKHDDALRCYHDATRVNPDHRAAWTNLGSIHISEDRLNEAVDCFKNALRADPEYAEARYNLGNVYKDQWRLDEAVECYQRALESDPGLSAAHINLGVVLKYQGKLDEAVRHHTRALEIKPGDSEAYYHRSEARLLHGDFKNGWSDYEWRWKYEARPRQFLQPVWDGTSLLGRSLLVYAEQGVGDEIMFASCLPELIGRTETCVIECDPRLVSLFSRSFPLAKVVSRPLEAGDDLEQSLPPIDVQIAFGSLPQYLRSSLDQFPKTQRFLVPDHQLRENWRSRLDELGDGLKVGISWRGGNKPELQRRRSMQLSQWATLFSVPGIQFVNLQYGDCCEELQTLREQTGVEIHDWDDADPLSDLDNFAAQIVELDLVISADNSTVHMAGAVGVPVWTLLPFAPNWRWMLNRDDSPWYPTMTLYRQQEPKNWEPVYEQIANDLRKVVENPSTLQKNAGEAESELHADSETERKKYEQIWTHDAYREQSFGLLDVNKAPLVEKLREYGVKTILDAGCGTGKLMQKFLTDYPDEFEIHGFDISRNCLDPYFDDIKDEILSVGCLWNPDDLSKKFDAVI
ncbi:MAG: tetratricopeptide repeat protein, partial [Planctomycetes bacterium]|nr:tetratricopeptide repeat protein [Planctomycetota bacterium]